MAGELPLVTAQISRDWARSSWRPQCYLCGRWIGTGGYYDVTYDDYGGGWVEGWSTCREHTEGAREEGGKEPSC